MNWDYVNAVFQLLGSVVVWLNVVSLYRAKRVHGVSPVATAYIVAWCVWNLFYYTELGQVASVWAGGLLVLGNSAWLYLMWYYRGN